MKKKNSIKSNIVLLVITLLCCVLIILSFTVDMTTGPFRRLGEYVITPLQSGISRAGNWISGSGDYFRDSAALSSENKKLTQKVDELTAENTQLVQDKEELNRLRDIYELDHQYEDYEKIGARVIAKKDSGNWFHNFTIDKGTDDGISVDCNVLAQGGLAGIVTETGPDWATVRTVIDDYSNVSAMVTPSNTQCIIAGDLRLMDEDKINLIKLVDRENKVNAGDKVVTSRVSSKFLPNLLIGYVSEVKEDTSHLTKSGYISPVVDFEDIQEVLVIKNLKKQVADTTEETEGESSGGTESETSSETQSETATAKAAGQ